MSASLVDGVEANFFMRELLYLSRRKLRQFDLGRPPWRRIGAHVNVMGEVKVPGIGGLTVVKGVIAQTPPIPTWTK